MRSALILLCSFSFTLASAFYAETSFDRCSPDDERCLNEAIENAIHYLSEKGIRELNIPKLDPIEIPQINIGTKANALDVSQEYSEVNLMGYKKAKIKNSRFNTKENVLVFSAVLPELKQTAKYDISGRLLVFPIFGNGQSTIIQSNVTVIHKLKFEDQVGAHLTLKSYVISVQPKHMKFEFDNLFNGNKVLSERIHAVVNNNWEVIWADSKKELEEAYGDVFYGFAHNFFEKVPVADIFRGFPS